MKRFIGIWRASEHVAWGMAAGAVTGLVLVLPDFGTAPAAIAGGAGAGALAGVGAAIALKRRLGRDVRRSVASNRPTRPRKAPKRLVRARP